jgi:hypothetical protein
MQQATGEHTERVTPSQPTEGRDNPTLGDILGQPTRCKATPPVQNNEHEDRLLLQTIKDNYDKDPLTQTVLTSPDNHRQHFRAVNGILWTKNFRRAEVICVPRENSLITQLLTKAHEIVGHYGDQRTCEYVRRWYWWPQMTKSAANFCKTCKHVNAQRAAR